VVPELGARAVSRLFAKNAAYCGLTLQNQANFAVAFDSSSHFVQNVFGLARGIVWLPLIVH
jgi:hypothetical protein